MEARVKTGRLCNQSCFKSGNSYHYKWNVMTHESKCTHFWRPKVLIWQYTDKFCLSRYDNLFCCSQFASFFPLTFKKVLVKRCNCLAPLRIIRISPIFFFRLVSCTTGLFPLVFFSIFCQAVQVISSVSIPCPLPQGLWLLKALFRMLSMLLLLSSMAFSLAPKCEQKMWTSVSPKITTL